MHARRAAQAVALALCVLGCHRFGARHHRAAAWTPAPPPTLVAGGATTCSIDDGEVTCWGRGLDATHVTRVDELRGARQIAVERDWWREDPDRPLSPGFRPLPQRVCGVFDDDGVRCTTGDGFSPRDAAEVVAAETRMFARTRRGDVVCERPDDTERLRFRALAGATRIATGHASEPGRAGRRDSSSFVCAILRSGRARCAGVPDGPRDFPGRRYVDVAVGPTRACAVTASGSVDCIDAMRGVEPPRLSFPPATRVSVGDDHVCVVTRTHEAACAGHGEHGQLGTGALDDTEIAVPVAGLTGVTEVAAGAVHTCVRHAGGVSCFGDGHWGATGPGALQHASTHHIPGARALYADGGSVCALDGSGTLWCFGENRAGQLGDGTARWRAAPVAVQLPGFGAITGEVSLVSGGACAIVDGGRVACWGGLDEARLDDQRDALAAVTRATALALDGSNVWVALADGTVQPYALASGALESGSFRAHGTPRTLLPGPRALVGGELEGVPDAHLGMGATLPEPVDAPGRVDHRIGCDDVPCRGRLHGIEQLVGRWGESCARLADGRVACWGDFDQLYDLFPSESDVPLFVPGLDDAQDVCLGAELCARHADGRVDCRGKERGGAEHDVPELRGAEHLVCTFDRRVCGIRGDDVVCASADGELGSLSAAPRAVSFE